MAAKSSSSRRNKLTSNISSRLDEIKRAKDNAAVAGLTRQLRYTRPTDSRPPKPIQDLLEPMMKRELQQRSVILAQASELFTKSLPQKVAASIALEGFSHGTLLVCTTSAPAKAELDRLLRQGLERQLQVTTNGAVFRVRTTINRKRLEDSY